MSLSHLLLTITMLLWGVSLLGLIAVSATVLGIFALATGVLFLLEGLSLFTYSTPTIKR